jgi:hypothetical protein
MKSAFPCEGEGEFVMGCHADEGWGIASPAGEGTPHAGATAAVQPVA